MFANTTPDIAALGIRATINNQLSRHFWHNGAYDEAVLLANHRALSRSPYLSTVIMPKGDTFVLRPVVKSSPAYGSIGDLVQLLRGLDDYPLMSDDVHSDLVHETVSAYVSQTYPDIEDSAALVSYIYENDEEGPYLEGMMTVYIPNESELVTEYRATLPALEGI